MKTKTNKEMTMAPKKLIENKARELGAEFIKVRTKTVSFEDLARGSARFIYFDGLVWTYENKWDELKLFAREQGYILGS